MNLGLAHRMNSASVDNRTLNIVGNTIPNGESLHW
ncbi:hypothetical protein GGE45_005618 [Rhizobium aethiopicum]|uniref:Uncharacterized protein n=1 Tax=Rhizobium aethiopicum TaxID=1138170 RepID=A0A7W6VSH9_9HYPH|nr:hypothetical protein [Rhizobium aethiopicum]MBB4583250.1 hypothetical protein [Rhizobium aethiopicum]